MMAKFIASYEIYQEGEFRSPQDNYSFGDLPIEADRSPKAAEEAYRLLNKQFPSRSGFKIEEVRLEKVAD